MLKIKLIIASLLCSNFIGKIIGFVFGNNIPFFYDRTIRINCDSNSITNQTKAQIFFELYESAEYRFCMKYICTDSIIVELGSSLGLISSVISKYKNPRKVFLVEANPLLTKILHSNLEFNKVKRYSVINEAVNANKNEDLWFHFGIDSTTGYIDKSPSTGSIKIPVTTLSELIINNNIREYTLICDIEGAEISILYEDYYRLAECTLIIIELHQGFYNGIHYSIEQLRNRVLTLGFWEKDRYGNTFVFSKI